MSIHILPPEVASQIAAGEVVERPASVIKELIENSLDADARDISIRYIEAGRRLMEVIDDGSGIPADQLDLALTRHATSKLQQVSELFSIATLGFRGEALASIGSVSNLTIISRPKASETAAKITVEAGKAFPLQIIAAPPGTLVRVEDLFFNVPARLKFLKKDITERRTMDGMIRRYALAYPKVRFKLNDENNTILQTVGDGDRRAILAGMYGVETAGQMLEVMAEEEMMKLTGFISPISITRSNRRDITFFVNGRWVQDTPLTAALVNAYHTLLMVARYPMAVLFLNIDPTEVDVNVHPAKAEVRFKDNNSVFSFVQRAARRALLAYSPIPSLQSQTDWGGSHLGTKQIDPAWDFYSSVDESLSPSPEQEKNIFPPESIPLPGPGLPLLRLIGQVGSTYLVAEGPDGLYLVDQHAAHERVLYEKLMTLHENQEIQSQNLLSPVSVTLPIEQASLIEEHLPILQDFGFKVELFGPGNFQIRAVPTLLMDGNPADAIKAVVEDFEEDERPLQDDLELRLAARVCKRLAVKAGQILSTEEQRSLLNDLEACQSPRTCPHGRPTMILLSVDLLERQFGRKGSR